MIYFLVFVFGLIGGFVFGVSGERSRAASERVGCTFRSETRDSLHEWEPWVDQESGIDWVFGQERYCSKCNLMERRRVHTVDAAGEVLDGL